jgi:glutamate-1-semialdehyde aminotransferase
MYGVRPDLLTMGKVIGGGMPVAAVGGRAEIMELVGRSEGQKVKFSGGTYSGHPASFLAAKTLISYLVEYENDIYPRLSALGEYTRRKVTTVFEDAGVFAKFTGGENDVISSHSMNMLVFPFDENCGPLNSPDQVLNPDIVDQTLGNIVIQLAMLLENVHIIHGLGVVTMAHTEQDIDRLCQSYRRVLQQLQFN